MSLLDKIEEIQKKPERTRYKILFASIVVIMAAIIALWMSFPDTDKTAGKNDTDLIGPFKMLLQEAKSALSR